MSPKHPLRAPTCQPSFVRVHSAPMRAHCRELLRPHPARWRSCGCERRLGTPGTHMGSVALGLAQSEFEEAVAFFFRSARRMNSNYRRTPVVMRESLGGRVRPMFPCTALAAPSLQVVQIRLDPYGKNRQWCRKTTFPTEVGCCSVNVTLSDTHTHTR